MRVAPDTGALCASIYNRAWFVRHYHRGSLTSIGRTERAEAIRELGLTCRHAFNVSDDFEAILTAVVNGLAIKDVEPPF